MPTMEVEIEVYCICGEHMGNKSEFGGRSRKAYQMTVEACPTCLAAAKEAAEEPLQDRIKELEDEIEELKNEAISQAGAAHRSSGEPQSGQGGDPSQEV